MAGERLAADLNRIEWPENSPSLKWSNQYTAYSDYETHAFNTMKWLGDFSQRASNEIRPASRGVLSPDFHAAAILLPHALQTDIVIPESWKESRDYFRATFFRIGKNLETYSRLMIPENLKEESADRLAVGFALKLHEQNPDAADMVLIGFAVGTYPPSEPQILEGTLDLTKNQVDMLVGLRVRLAEKLKGKSITPPSGTSE